MKTANPTFFWLIQTLYAHQFLLKQFFKIFTFEKNPNFSEKKPSEGLELVILLHTQYYALTLRHHKLIINDDSHPNYFCLI